MVTKEIVINIPTLDEVRRPVALLVQMASQYESSIYIECDENKTINAKSIMGMMTIGITKGEKIKLTVNGADEEAAMKEITDYLTGTAQ